MPREEAMGDWVMKVPDMEAIPSQLYGTMYRTEGLEEATGDWVMKVPDVEAIPSQLYGTMYRTERGSN